METASKDFNWRKGIIRANDINLAWEELGAPQGEPLLLVMGLGAQLIHWPDTLCGALAQRGFRVIRFDNRDSGLSQDVDLGVRFDIRKDLLRSRLGIRPAANYTLYDMADDAVGLLDGLAVPRAHLVGASMGGMIAQIIAARHPQRALSLMPIMSSTNHPRMPPPRLDLIWHMFGRRPRDAGRDTMVRRSVNFHSRIGSPGYPTPRGELRSLVERTFDRAFRPAGLRRQTHAILATGSFEDTLGRIRQPTQIIHGLSDPLLRASCGQRIARSIPGARLELVKGMGHDCPSQLMPRWVELLTENAGRV